MPNDDPIVPSNSGPERMEGQPPVFSSWGGFYAFVLILHTVILILFYLLTRAYA